MVYVNNVNRLIFVTGTIFVLCEVGTECVFKRCHKVPGTYRDAHLPLKVLVCIIIQLRALYSWICGSIYRFLPGVRGGAVG